MAAQPDDERHTKVRSRGERRGAAGKESERSSAKGATTRLGCQALLDAFAKARALAQDRRRIQIQPAMIQTPPTRRGTNLDPMPGEGRATRNGPSVSASGVQHTTAKAA